MSPNSPAKAHLKSQSKLLAVLAIILLLLVNAGYSSEHYYAHGTVTNAPHGGFPETHITARTVDDNQVVGTATTDENGAYSLSFGFVNVSQYAETSHALRVHPNPFGRNAMLHALVPSAGEYTLEVSDINGKLLMQQKLFLEAGAQQIPVQDEWSEGLRIFHLFGKDYSSRTKGVQSAAVQSGGSWGAEPVSTKSEKQNQGGRTIKLTFESSQHETFDTIIDFMEGESVLLDVVLQQLSQSKEAQFAVSLSNLPMEVAVQGAQIQLSDLEGEVLAQGESTADGQAQLLFDNDYWAWQGDTLFALQQIQVLITAGHHEPQEWVMDYSHHTDTTVVLQQQKQFQQGMLSVEVDNSPMQQFVAGAALWVEDEHGQELAQVSTNAQGSISHSIERGFYAHQGDTLADFMELYFSLSATHHQPWEAQALFAQNIQLHPQLQQVAYEEEAHLELTLNSLPLNYAPSGISLEVQNLQEEVLASTTISEGQAALFLDFVYYVNGSDTLKMVGQHTANELVLLLESETHHPSQLQHPLYSHILIETDVEQIPQQAQTTITTHLVGNIFGEAPNGVNIQYKNNENNEELTQGQTTNGQHTAQINYNYWEHEDLEHQDLNEIKQTITKNGVYEEIEQILSNQDHDLELTLTQIPEYKTAEITGTVKNTDNEALQGAEVQIKTQDETHTTLTTNTNGVFNHTGFEYIKYTNPENQEETQTTPENIHAKITKPTYETHTTESQTLEDLVDFGTIQLTPQPITKTLNFTAKHIQVTGDAQHPQNQYEITFGDQVHTYTIGEDNEININITAEITNGEDQVIIRNIPYEASPNTPISNDIVMIAYQNRPAFERAIASNQMFANTKYTNDQRNHLELDLEQINNKHNLEIIDMRNYFVNGEDFIENHLQPDTIFMNTIIPAQILGMKSSGINHHWEPYDHNGTLIDKVQFVHVKAEINTGNPMPPEVTNRWNYAINLTKDASYRRDGQPTLEYELLEFDSFEDPEYLELANRTPAFRNTVRIFSDNSVTMATNGTSYVAGGIIARGQARGPPTPLPHFTTGEEVLEATYSMANSTASGTSSGVFILTTNNDGDVVTSEMGYNLIMFRQQFPKAKQYTIAPPNK